MAVMLFLFLAVLGSVWILVWARIVEAAQVTGPLYGVLAGVFFASFALQLLRWILRDLFDRRLWLQRLAYYFFGLMIVLVATAIAKDLTLLAFRLAGNPPDLSAQRWAAGLAFLAGVLGERWGYLTATRGPGVRAVTVPLTGWAPSQAPLRLAQISDLHVSSSIRAPYVKNVVEKTNSQNPDVIVLTGDLGDGRVEDLADDLAPLRELRARYGVFYVLGNHEYYWNAPSWTAKMRSLGFTALENEGRWLEEAKVWIGGVPDISAHRMIAGSVSEPSRAAPPSPKPGPSILLAHQPKSIFAAAQAGFDLMLCGHTHAGQFFPANLVVRFFNPYHYGLHRHERTWIYVNPGTGFWGPPLRLFVPPEITLLTLVPEKRSASQD